MAEALAGYRWAHVARIGVVQAAIGAVVVLLTSTLNRVMVVELAWPAVIPGLLVAGHNVIQMALRPSMGHGSDVSGRREGWITGGMLLLALAGVGAAASTALMATNRGLGLAAAAVCFLGVGAGVSAAGTPLLALLAERVHPSRRARAAALVWIMMIAGFIITTLAVSKLLVPFSWERLVMVAAQVGGAAFVAAALAVRGLERAAAPLAGPSAPAAATDFRTAFGSVWGDPAARAFCWFIAIAMFAYSAQDLILEPFAGMVFGMSPAESTAISGIHQRGLLLGMLGTAWLAPRFWTSAKWASLGCVLSAAFFVLLAATPLTGSALALKATLVGLGFGNGMYSIGALASMMALTAETNDGKAGIRMGVFGAAQAIAMGTGNFLGAAGSDVARGALGSSTGGYVAVFVVEAVLFGVGAVLALRATSRAEARLSLARADGDAMLAAIP